MDRRLVAPAVGTGVFMALYLTTRPYGDASADPQTIAAAFASPWWVVAHVSGMAALASAARLGVLMFDVAPSGLSAVARWSGLAGLVLVLPYYGAETFALHVLGQHAAAGDLGALEVAQQIRNGGVAMTMFGAGLLSLAVSGIASALAWARAGSPRWAATPLGVCIATVLPQFFLPPAGRVGFGIVTLGAALLLAWHAARRNGHAGRVRRGHEGVQRAPNGTITRKVGGLGGHDDAPTCAYADDTTR